MIFQVLLYLIGDHFWSSFWFSNKQHYLSVQPTWLCVWGVQQFILYLPKIEHLIETRFHCLFSMKKTFWDFELWNVSEVNFVSRKFSRRDDSRSRLRMVGFRPLCRSFVWFTSTIHFKLNGILNLAETSGSYASVCTQTSIKTVRMPRDQNPPRIK